MDILPDIETTRARYVSLRSRGWRKSVNQQIITLQIRQNQLVDQLKTATLDAAVRLQAQKELQTVRAQIRQLNKVVDNTVTYDGAKEEFQKILYLEGIKEIEVRENELRLLVEARFVYKGVVYDFGEWRLIIAIDSVRAVRVRSGLLDLSHDRQFLYHNYGSDFCFGNRQSILDDHARRGQLLEAMYLAMNSISSVNSGHERFVPGSFKKVGAADAS